MRLILLVIVVSFVLSAACGEGSETDISPDSTASTPADLVEIQVQHTSPQDAITGAYNLIDEARSVTDEANARTEELEQLMGDN